MSINERIKFIIEEKENGKQSAFAQKVGISPTVVGTFMPAKREGDRVSKPGYEVLLKIIEAYPELRTDWLLTGKGEPFNMIDLDNLTRDVALVENGNVTKSGKRIEHQLIPLYNLMAAAGLVTLFNSNQHILDYISIPNLPKCDGAVYVAGDSMYPLLKSGDIVIFREIQNKPHGIRFGEMHVIDFMPDQDYITAVKYVQKSALGPEYIKLVSENRYHPEEDIPLSQVRAIAVVKASIRINSMV